MECRHTLVGLDDVIKRVHDQEERELAETFLDSCGRAAEAIKHADMLLLATGAGMSADSGLPVYRDIANVEVYKQGGLTYAHLCRTTWLPKQPEVFYGFWGACLHDYQSVSPHQGYQIIRGWRERCFLNSAGSERRRRILDLLKQRQFYHYEKPLYDEDETNLEASLLESDGIGALFADSPSITSPQSADKLSTCESAEPAPGPFFIFTSNVDGHHQKAGFSPDEIYEVHGSMEEWQCSIPCLERTWPLPSSFTFSIDREQMIAYSNFPKCDKCGAYARPAVQMYYDMRKTRNERQLRRYMSWKRAMLDVLHSIPESRLVVLEIGCGTNVKTCDASPLLRGILTGEKVPTVRVESEELLAKSEEGRCTLIRINLDYPKCHWRPHLQKNTISIQASALRALHEIDQQLA